MDIEERKVRLCLKRFGGALERPFEDDASDLIVIDEKAPVQNRFSKRFKTFSRKS